MVAEEVTEPEPAMGPTYYYYSDDGYYGDDGDYYGYDTPTKLLPITVGANSSSPEKMQDVSEEKVLYLVKDTFGGILGLPQAENAKTALMKAKGPDPGDDERFKLEDYLGNTRRQRGPCLNGVFLKPTLTQTGNSQYVALWQDRESGEQAWSERFDTKAEAEYAYAHADKETDVSVPPPPVSTQQAIEDALNSGIPPYNLHSRTRRIFRSLYKKHRKMNAPNEIRKQVNAEYKTFVECIKEPWSPVTFEWWVETFPSIAHYAPFFHLLVQSSNEHIRTLAWWQLYAACEQFPKKWKGEKCIVNRPEHPGCLMTGPQKPLLRQPESWKAGLQTSDDTTDSALDLARDAPFLLKLYGSYAMGIGLDLSTIDLIETIEEWQMLGDIPAKLLRRMESSNDVEIDWKTMLACTSHSAKSGGRNYLEEFNHLTSLLGWFRELLRPLAAELSRRVRHNEIEDHLVERAQLLIGWVFNITVSVRALDLPCYSWAESLHRELYYLTASKAAANAVHPSIQAAWLGDARVDPEEIEKICQKCGDVGKMRNRLLPQPVMTSKDTCPDKQAEAMRLSFIQHLSAYGVRHGDFFRERIGSVSDRRLISTPIRGWKGARTSPYAARHFR